MSAPSKTAAGRFFEDFRLGETLRHATPRTLTVGRRLALFGALRLALRRAERRDLRPRDRLSRSAPIDDLLAFHVVFGKTVPDVSLNAIANLGYADGRFLEAGLSRRHADGDLRGDRPQGELEPPERRRLRAHAGLQPARRAVLDYVRWVMVRKRDAAAPAPRAACPRSARGASRRTRSAPPARRSTPPPTTSRSPARPHRWGDYATGERIDHVDGVTVEEAEHQIATRLYQNTAKVHFNQFSEGQGRFGRRLIYGGHVISLARALSFNGLANAFHVAAINGGRHVAPLFAGDTVFAWSEVLETAALPGRDDVGALRAAPVATKNRPCGDFPSRQGEGYEPSVVLDLDYWALLPR